MLTICFFAAVFFSSQILLDKMIQNVFFHHNFTQSSNTRKSQKSMENPELLPISFRICQVLGMALVLAALVAWVSAIRARNPQEDKMLRLLEESVCFRNFLDANGGKTWNHYEKLSYIIYVYLYLCIPQDLWIIIS